MERVLILGSSGSGKSSLAAALSARLGVPLVHLDRLFWRPGWVQSTTDEFVAAQARALPADGRWVCDGNYSKTLRVRLPLADTIVLLDLPTLTCLRRVLLRSLRWYGRWRPDMSDGCVERPFRRDYLDFMLYILRYRRRSLPHVRALIESHAPQARLFHLRSDGAIAQFLDEATRAAGDGTANRRAAQG
jgi:adenylate kinase family enzyme